LELGIQRIPEAGARLVVIQVDQLRLEAAKIGIYQKISQNLITWLTRHFSPTKPTSRAWSDSRSGDERAGGLCIEMTLCLQVEGESGLEPYGVD
jgi:hypothetical protein